MNWTAAVRLLDSLHTAQNAFYGGGGDGPLRRLLVEDVMWTVPGRNSIAGVYQGIEEVLAYFAWRRVIASATLRMYRVDVLTGTTDKIAALTDGTAVIDGTPRQWSTIGLYGVRGDRIAACWLLPLDAKTFDEIWTA